MALVLICGFLNHGWTQIHTDFLRVTLLEFDSWILDFILESFGELVFEFF